jgi:hypothetical protein
LVRRLNRKQLLTLVKAPQLSFFRYSGDYSA